MPDTLTVGVNSSARTVYQHRLVVATQGWPRSVRVSLAALSHWSGPLALLFLFALAGRSVPAAAVGIAIIAVGFACISVWICGLYFEKGRPSAVWSAASRREVRPTWTAEGQRRRRQRRVTTWIVSIIVVAGGVLFSTSWAEARPGVLDAIILVTLAAIGVLLVVAWRARKDESRTTSSEPPPVARVGALELGAAQRRSFVLATGHQVPIQVERRADVGVANVHR